MRSSDDVPEKLAERLLVALGRLRKANAWDICQAAGLNPHGQDFVWVQRALTNSHAMGLVHRGPATDGMGRRYRLTAAGCELAMLVSPSGELPDVEASERRATA